MTQFKHQSPDHDVEIVVIKTAGDQDKKSPLSAIGGKGVFVKEIEEALLDGRVDVGCHSLKDMTSDMPDTLDLAAFLKPESISDALVCRDASKTLKTLPSGARIGTGSARRKARLMQLRPGLVCVELRGNVDTRLKKMESGEVDAVMLSEAGLIRLGLQHKVSERLDPAHFCPAPGQGVIALQVRKDNTEVYESMAALSDPTQDLISRAEMTLLGIVGFNCRIPLGLYTRLLHDGLYIKVFMADPSLTRVFEKDVVIANALDKSEIQRLGQEMKAWLTQ